MLWERLEILLMPRLLVLQRTSINRWRHGGIAARSERVDQAETSADWRAAVAALGKVLAREARHATRVHIALSDLWVRSHLMPATPTRLSEDEMLLLARTHFARQYPETGQDNWTFRLALQGTRLLVAGMESGLLEAIKETNANAGARLRRTEPLFSWVYDRFERALADATGWMLLDEPGMLTLAFVERGRLTSLHCQRCENDQGEIAVRLLERQSALLAQQSAEVRVFSVDARLIHLPAPWRIVSRQRIVDFNDSVNLTPTPAPLALVALASAAAMRRWRPFWSALFGVAIAAVIGAAVWVAFIQWNLWVPAASALAVIPLMYVSLGGWSYVVEQLRRREITRVFSLYVSPQVVDYMIAHPERINLGGERREITLMFTDLKGFTPIAEKHTPEQVTQLVNRHFTAMTDIVLEHEGTVVQFVGDAIMAFWGAPLDDADHAYRAVAAAVAMQNGMAALRAEFAKEGLPPIHMRVGIHTGSVLVGNLGSAKRFGYTAVGDDVNLAARLEGVNKLYGTGVMVSGDTARRITGRIALRPVDRVIVKGRSQAIDVLTPCDDPKVIELTQKAISLFRSRDWDAAESRLRELLALVPDDGIAELYLGRIAAFRVAPPAATWDGSVELDKL